MIIFSLHAERQLIERNIKKSEVEKVLSRPDRILKTDIDKRRIFQKILMKNRKKFLYRVVFAEERSKKFVITAYRTTKLDKYLKEESL